MTVTKEFPSRNDVRHELEERSHLVRAKGEILLRIALRRELLDRDCPERAIIFEEARLDLKAPGIGLSKDKLFLHLGEFVAWLAVDDLVRDAQLPPGVVLKCGAGVCFVRFRVVKYLVFTAHELGPKWQRISQL